ncbi:WGR domain-containing protein [Ruegeria atlantica]|uniref:WGR domain-containing protein n=1 Tax=Ruegeria atlantica TaxID=81569 RepID=UPI0014805B31|nr:WGR domain-containing protein [Ruegeria atlantica]
MIDNRAMELTETKPIHLIHVDPDVNMARFYGIELQPTLFGEHRKVWGNQATICVSS